MGLNEAPDLADRKAS